MTMTPAQIEAVVAAPELPEVSVLRVQPGDTIVLRFRRVLTDEEFDDITTRWGAELKDRFPASHIAIIEGDADIVVLRKDGE